MTIRLFIFLIILLSGCTLLEEKEVKIKPIETIEPLQEPPPLQPHISPDLLQGAWTDGSTENATFAFIKEGIQYVDNLQIYSYKITGDSINIHFEDYDFKARINLQNDTLVLSDENGDTKFWRLRN